jgi:alkylhydroperoxidase family enzyme
LTCAGCSDAASILPSPMDSTRATRSAPKHYDDAQIAALVSLVAMINAANRLAVIVHQQGGPYEPGMFAGLAS